MLKRGSALIDRLAGLLVILAVVVVTVGFLLPPQPEWASKFQVLPPPPPVEVPDIAQVQPVAPPASTAPVATLDRPAEAADRPCSFGLDRDTGLQTACSLRVGLFGNPRNVQRVLKKLRDADYNPYVRRVPSGDRVLTGVYIGSWFSRQPMAAAKRKVEKLLGEKGLVSVRHVPPSAHAEGFPGG